MPPPLPPSPEPRAVVGAVARAGAPARAVAAPCVGGDAVGRQPGERLDAVTGLAQRVGLQAREQGTVERAAGTELVVGAVLDDPAAVEHDDPVGQVQGRDAMRDEHRGAPGQHVAQPVVDRLLGAGVDRARRVVEHEDARVGQDGAGQRDALPLPAGQRQAPLAHHGVVAGGQVAHEAVGLRRPGGRDDLGLARVRAAVGDVRADRVGEQEALLEGDADAAAQRVQGQLAHVVPVDDDPAAVGIVLARDQCRQRRLAAAARPDEGDALSGRDVQVDAVEHGRAGGVAEADVVEADVTVQVGQLERVRGVGDRRLQVEHAEDALDPGAGLLAHGEDAGQLPGRRGELADVGREGQERADRDRAVQGEQAAEDEDRHLRDGRDRLEQRLVARLQAHRAQARTVEPLGGRGEPAELALLLAEGLDHAHAGDALVDDLGDVALALLPVPRGREHPPPHPVGDGEQRRDDDEREQSQQRREDEHHHQRQQHHQHVAGHQRQEVQQTLHQRRVGVGAGDQLTGRHPRQRCEVHALQVVVDRVAQVELDAEADLAAAVTPHVGERERQSGGGEQQHQPRPQRVAAGDDHLVEDLPGDERDERLRRTADDRGRHGEDDVATVPHHAGPQPAHPARVGAHASPRTTGWRRSDLITTPACSAGRTSRS